jgi:hypothetical protein
VLVVPAGTGIGQRESASFQSVANRRLLRRSSAKQELAEGLHDESSACTWDSGRLHLRVHVMGCRTGKKEVKVCVLRQLYVYLLCPRSYLWF